MGLRLDMMLSVVHYNPVRLVLGAPLAGPGPCFYLNGRVIRAKEAEIHTKFTLNI